MKETNNLFEFNQTSLEKNYQDRITKNKDFKKYIEKIELNEKKLMSYTSQLEDSFKESQNCENCQGYEYCKNTIKGYVLTPIVEKELLNFSYIICKYKEEIEKKTEYQKNINFYEIPKELKNASLKELYKDDKKRMPIYKFLKDFIKEYDPNKKMKGLYLTGSFGSGKTYIISALFNELAKKGVQSTMIYYPEFLRSLKESFGDSYTEKFRSVKKSPLLLLDDIGAENQTNWTRDEVLGPILQYRMEEGLPTFFTSNLTIEELESAIAITTSGVDKIKARRIIERIKQLTISLELVSKNRRDKE